MDDLSFSAPILLNMAILLRNLLYNNNQNGQKTTFINLVQGNFFLFYESCQHDLYVFIFFSLIFVLFLG